MKAPLVCAEGWDIGVFDSPRDLERAVEALDVKDGIYECFDSEGVVLRLCVSRGDRVSVEEALPRCVEAERLVNRLRESLTMGRSPVETEGLDLAGLIEAVRRRK